MRPASSPASTVRTGKTPARSSNSSNRAGAAGATALISPKAGISTRSPKRELTSRLS
jgi:hypothetical protein